MKRVIIESPFAGDVDRNRRYLRACMADSLARDEAPFASHGLYTQEGVLDDTVPAERKRGIEAGYAWWEGADLVAFYIDLGWSDGMRRALRFAQEGMPLQEGEGAILLRYEPRMLGGEW
jgi:hypothetical protein